MSTTITVYRQQVLREVELLPEEYLPFLAQVMRAFRESVTLKPAAESFRQGWHEARQGEILPVETLWEGLDDQ